MGAGKLSFGERARGRGQCWGTQFNGQERRFESEFGACLPAGINGQAMSREAALMKTETLWWYPVGLVVFPFLVHLSSTPLKGNPRRGTQGGGTLEVALRSGRAPVHTWTG